MSHLEQRANRWYAVLTIPTDVRHHFDNKIRFVKSTGTSDKRAAQARAYALVAEWKAEIERARGQSEETPILSFALEARKELDQLLARGDFEQHEALSYAISSKAELIDADGQVAEAPRFARVALGMETPIEPELEEWHSTLHLKQKTVEQMEKDAKLMAAHFGVVEAITPEQVRAWAKTLMAPKEEDGLGYGVSSVKRIFSASRSVWHHLQEAGKAPTGSEPFKLPSFIQRHKDVSVGKKKNGKGWQPFKPDEVVNLYRAAIKDGDASLADLIRLGMYTGARIEELCSLQLASCSLESLQVRDSKTHAGVREIPVHPQIADTVERLLTESTDGYLLSGLTFNKYGDRSNAIGKRFGRLKAELGFSNHHVFHSIRKTVVTLLEDAGATENLTADIIGHKKPRITYGLYSGGHSLAKKQEAIKLLRYPFDMHRS